MTTDLPPLPDGPINHMPAGYATTVEREQLLHQALAGAGIKLGAYDEVIADWLATMPDWWTFATITSWIRQAGSGGVPSLRDCSTCEHHLPATPAEEQCNPDGCGCTGYPEACDVRAAPAGAVFPISNCPSWQASVTGPA